MPSTPPSPNDLTRQQLDELDALLQRMLSLPLPPSGPAVAPAVAADAPPLPDFREPEPVSAPAGWRADVPTSVKGPYLTTKPQRQPVLTPAFVPLVPLSPAPSMVAAAAVSAAPRRTESAYPTPAPEWERGPEVDRHTSADEPDPEPAPSVRLFGPPTPDTGISPSTEPEPQATPGTLRGVDAPALPPDFRTAFANTPERPAEPPPETVESQPTPRPANPSVFLAAADEPQPSAVPVVLWPVFALNWVLEMLLGLLGPVGAILTHPAAKHLLGVVGFLLLVAAGAWAARGMGWVAFPIPR